MPGSSNHVKVLSTDFTEKPYITGVWGQNMETLGGDCVTAKKTTRRLSKTGFLSENVDHREFALPSQTSCLKNDSKNSSSYGWLAYCHRAFNSLLSYFQSISHFSSLLLCAQENLPSFQCAISRGSSATENTHSSLC